MDWNAITAITGALAALFIGLSVVYLALQIGSGTQAWWKDRKFAFSKRLREFLDSSRPEEVRSPQTRRV